MAYRSCGYFWLVPNDGSDITSTGKVVKLTTFDHSRPIRQATSHHTVITGCRSGIHNVWQKYPANVIWLQRCGPVGGCGSSCGRVRTVFHFLPFLFFLLLLSLLFPFVVVFPLFAVFLFVRQTTARFLIRFGQ